MPIRGISEALGATLNWDSATEKAIVTKDNASIEITLHSKIAYINNTPYILDVPAKRINNRILVLLRFISEAFDYEVSWNSSYSIAFIGTSAEDKLEPSGILFCIADVDPKLKHLCLTFIP